MESKAQPNSDFPEWYYSSSRREIHSFIPPNARKVLDVGCGEGNFGGKLKANTGAEVWGIEYNPEAGEKAQSKLDKVFVGDAGEILLRLDPGTFDCIVLLDILEHLVDPYSVLLHAKDLLTSTGCIVLSVPNVLYISNLYRLLIKKDWEYVDNGVLDRTHLRFFTKKSLLNSLRKLGFHIIKLQGINPLKGFLFTMFDLLTLGYYHEAKDLQFVCIIKPM